MSLGIFFNPRTHLIHGTHMGLACYLGIEKAFPVTVEIQARKGYFGFISHRDTQLKCNKIRSPRILSCNRF